MTNHTKITVTACMAILALYGCGSEDTQDGDLVSETPTEAASEACSPETSPDINCDCVDTLVAENWHDDPDLDGQTLMDSDSTDMSQAAIDVVMDIAVDASTRCKVTPDSIQ